MNRIQKLSLFSAAMIAITAPSETFAKSKVNTSDSITQEQAVPVPVEQLQARSKPPVFSTLQWNARALVLTGNADDPMVAQQMQIFRNNIEGLKKRDIAVIRFLYDNLDEIDELSDFDYRGWYDMDAAEQGFMEDQLGTDNNVFSVVLIGKDGELKQVWAPENHTVSIEWIFGLIDSMPMRKREMNEQ